jgi:hypothetical protein
LLRVPVRCIDVDADDDVGVCANGGGRDDDDDDFDAELFDADFVAAVDDFIAAGAYDADDEDFWDAADDGG